MCSLQVFEFPHESGLIYEPIFFVVDFYLLLLLVVFVFWGLTLYVFLHLTVMYSFTFGRGGWVLAVYIWLVGLSFGSFSLWELTCMRCVYLVLWTHQALCGSFMRQILLFCFKCIYSFPTSRETRAIPKRKRVVLFALTHVEVPLSCLIFWVSYAAFGNLPYGAILTSHSQYLTALTKVFMYRGCLPNSP